MNIIMLKYWEDNKYFFQYASNNQCKYFNEKYVIRESKYKIKAQEKK